MITRAKHTDQVTELELTNKALSLEAATEGIVLLKNNGGLPLEPSKIALFGSGAQYTIHGGSGSGEVNVRHNVTIKEGLEEAEFEITTNSWIERYDRQWKKGKAAFLSKYRKKLLWPNSKMWTTLMAADYKYPSGDLITEAEVREGGADTCIYVLSRKSGEGHDCEDAAGSFRLDMTEEQNIRFCTTHFANFILVINTGSPIDLSSIENLSGIKAIVYMGQLGMEGGRALASMLTGKSCPSGKLAVSWPKKYKDVPFGQEFGKDASQADYKEGIYVGYRYYDSFGIKPRYPFGYGLSYTSFTIEHLQTTLDKDCVGCSVEVKNTGNDFAGKEVVQVYVSCPGEDREYQRLVAFDKTDILHPSQSETLSLSFTLTALATYDEKKAQTLISQGEYLIRIGNSSDNTEPVAIICINKDVVLTQHKNLCTAPNKIAELKHNNKLQIPDNLPKLIVDTDCFTTHTIDYSANHDNFSEKSLSAMHGFTAEDYVNFCAGTGMSGEKAGFRTPGAVGHTSTAYIDKGIANIELCDGPAGVRLEKRAVHYPDGDIKSLDLSISLYEFFPNFLLKLLVLGNPKKGKVVYQYVTGFPIEAVVAQTWNTKLAERIGKAVSQEMSEFGVGIWLAPAINIVRNPLCGRNYEYYSEDPLLTGKMAAATTKGVEATKGNFVTLKHFCVNNQETYRYTVSSQVDERVLREIYWKGFEIAIKEAHPHSIMTAYNKLNGTYCANNKQLCTDLLRGEWEFRGIVMTDWMSTGKGKADEAMSIQSGVDIIMPGGKEDVQTLITAHNEGKLSVSDMQRAATRVINIITLADRP